MVINDYIGKIFFKDARDMCELPDNSVQLAVTSPPYFNIKDYSKDGYQTKKVDSYTNFHYSSTII